MWTTVARLLAFSTPQFHITSDIKQALSRDEASRALIWRIQFDANYSGEYTNIDGLLFKGKQIYVPSNSELHHQIFNSFQCSISEGHSGIKGTMARIAGNFYWPILFHPVRDFVTQCSICLQSKLETTPPKGVLQQLSIPAQILEDISMDFIAHLPPSSDKTSIWAIVDRLSKYTHFCALLTSVRIRWTIS